MAFYGTNPTGGYFKMTPRATVPTFPGTYGHGDKEGTFYFNDGTGTITSGLYVYVAGTDNAFVSITPNVDAALLTTGQLASDRGGVPIGGVITYAGPVGSAPLGYLLCDGATINASGTSAYAALWSKIGNDWGGTSATDMKVPDFRGYFLRGLTSDTGRDPDATSGRTPQGTGASNEVGSYQAEQFLSHVHSSYAPIGEIHEQAGGWLLHSQSQNTGAAGGNETRPKNMYVNFYIKYIAT